MKMLACGCVRKTQGGALHGWAYACAKHVLAATRAEKTGTFPPEKRSDHA